MLDLLERAISAGTISALRKAAARQRALATSRTSSAGENYPGVVIRSPEAACAINLAGDWTVIADALEMEGGQ